MCGVWMNLVHVYHLLVNLLMVGVQGNFPNDNIVIEQNTLFIISIIVGDQISRNLVLSMVNELIGYYL